MIQPNELRQGVLVSEHESCNGGHIQTVEGININGFDPGGILLGNGDVYEPDELYPIPLTEEWLLRLGFEKGGADDGVIDWHFKCQDSKSYTGIGVLFTLNFHAYQHYYFFNSLRFRITKIHQLQNLFLDLTGQELTIKIKQ